MKEAAKTLNFLIDNDLTDYGDLAARAEQAGEKFGASSRRIKQLEAQLSDEYARLLAEKQAEYEWYSSIGSI